MRALSFFVAAILASACSDGGSSDPISGIQSLCDAVSTEDLLIESQADLDALADVELVNGDLIVCTTVDITDLSLPLLTGIRGNLVIYGTVNLESVSLPLLETIGESPSALRSWTGLLLEGNTQLESFEAPLLRSVSQHVWLADNAAMTTIDLPALSRVRGAFALRATQIEALDGFAELRFVGGAVAVYDNTEITEVTGLTSLVTVSSELLFTNNAQLTTVTLPELRTVGGFVEIADDPDLAQLDLPALTTIGSGLTLTNTDLADASGLSVLDTVAGNLSVTYNAALADLTLAALQQVGGDLLIANNETLAAGTLDLLSFIGNDLTVSDNVLLGSLSFAALADIAGNLVVSDNDVFPTCAAEALRDAVGTDNIGGDVSIAGNDDEATCP